MKRPYFRETDGYRVECYPLVNGEWEWVLAVPCGGLLTSIAEGTRRTRRGAVVAAQRAIARLEAEVASAGPS